MGIDDAAMRLKCITKHKVVIKIKLNKCRKREDLRMIKGTEVAGDHQADLSQLND